MQGRARQWILTCLLAAGFACSAYFAVDRWVNAARTGWTGLIPAREMRDGRRTMRVEAVPQHTPANSAGLKPGDEVVAIDGAPLGRAGLRGALRPHKPGDVLVFRLRRENAELLIPVRLASPLLQPEVIVNQALNVLAALVFLGIGSFVFWKRGDDIRTLLFFVTCSVFGLARLVWSGPMRRYGLGTPDNAVLTIFALGLTFFLFPPLLHFCLVFPKRRPLLERYPGVLGWIYGPSAGTVVLFGALALFTLGPDRPERRAKDMGDMLAPWLEFGYRYVAIAFAAVAAGTAPVAMSWVRAIRGYGWRKTILSRPILTLGLILLTPSTFTLGCLSWASLRGRPQDSCGWALAVWGIAALALMLALLAVQWLVLPIAACVSLFRSYREGDLEQRQQMRWPVWGVITGVSAIYLSGPVLDIAGRLLRLRPGSWHFEVLHFLSANLDAICVMLIPIAFMFAILKYRLMEIEVYIRKTVIYGMLTGLLGLMYLVLAGGVGGFLGRYFRIQNDWMLSAATVLVAVAFVPVRNRVQGFVDRRFFRRTADPGEALKALMRAVAAAPERRQMLQASAEQLQLALQNRSVACFARLPGEREFRVVAKVGLPDEICDKAVFRAESAGSFAGNIATAAKADLPDTEREILHRTGSALIVPIRRKGELLGFFALGTKLSDEEYDARDADFLATAADQVAIALETVRFEEQQHEVERAFEIQKGLLPKTLPHIPGLTISGRWEPARTVSGDYYDVMDLGEGRLALVIADVSGKGIAASLLMSNLQAAVKAIAPGCPSPADLCKRVNRIVSGNAARAMFITCFYGVIDRAASRLTYCNAGHNPPLVWRKGSIERLEKGGMVLGVFPIVPYEQGEIALEPGDRLLLYTDGVSEAENADGEDFGEERLAALLGAPGGATAEEIESSVLAAVTEFCGGNFHDDATLIAITVEDASQ